jgi:ribonuclease HI
MKYYTDGSSTIGVKSAYVVVDERGKVVSMFETYNNGGKREFTNNEEEYRGVIHALELCNPGDIVYTDSSLVVNQIYGKYKVKKEHLKPLCQKAQELVKQRGASVVWISRDINLAGKIFER